MRFQTSQFLIQGTTLILVGIGNSSAVEALTITPLEEVSQYTTVVNNDPTDIYYPLLSDPTASTPVVLMLQGALVDQADYSNYASIVASYGFTVVVPNNSRTVSAPSMPPFSGFFPEQDQVQEILDFATLENTNPNSPIAGLLDTDSLGLLGHSFGGAVGIAATQNICFPVLCTDENNEYTVPEELKAGIFYGTNFDPSQMEEFPEIENEVPTGLIFGTRDGVAIPAETVTTFNQILNPPKVLVEVNGANHYGITNTDSFRDPIRPTLDQAVATETIGRWSSLFLRAHILDDDDAWNYIYTSQGDALDNNVQVTAVIPFEAETSIGFAIFGFWLGWRVYRRRKKRKSSEIGELS